MYNFKGMLKAIAFLLLLATLAVALLAIFQRRLIYFPRAYTDSELKILEPGSIRIVANSAQGRQSAFLFPARAGGEATETVWIVFSGNASLALFWADIVRSSLDDTAAFLLIDYPGYGLSEGSPSRDAIAEGAGVLWRAAVEKLGRTPKRIGVLGHSLGSAAALDFAVTAEPPVSRVVLLSPFVSLAAMVELHYFSALSLLLRDRFDNTARLRELIARSPAPEIEILHGTKDEIIPVEMGRSLASLSTSIRYREFPEVSHNDLIANRGAEVLDALRR